VDLGPRNVDFLKDEVLHTPLLLATAGVERMGKPQSVMQMPQTCFPMFTLIKIFSTRLSPALESLPTHQLGRHCSQSGGSGGGGALQRQRYRVLVEKTNGKRKSQKMYHKWYIHCTIYGTNLGRIATKP